MIPAIEAAEDPTAAFCEVRIDTAPGEDAADGIWAGCSEEREARGEETPDL
jgi:hypothetical protein